MSEYEHCIGCNRAVEVWPNEDYTGISILCSSCALDILISDEDFSSEVEPTPEIH